MVVFARVAASVGGGLIFLIASVQRHNNFRTRNRRYEGQEN